MTSHPNSIAIVGGGPAGLMAAEVLSQHGVRADVYDAMPSLGRKFLMAGKSGLNLTHAEPFERFIQRYSAPEVADWLNDFNPDDLRDWARGLGIETFVGTSGRVFPVGMKASPLLRAWLKRLDGSGVTVHLRQKWTGWDSSGALRFETSEGERLVRADATILALGGGSWARLGSTGEWVDGLRQAGVRVRELRPANCGFDVDWSEHFRTRFEGQPIKSVVLTFGDFQQQGEFIITREGVEGSLIYAASARLCDEIEAHGRAVLLLDLAPGSTQEKLTASLSKPRGSRSMSSHIERTVGLKGVKVGLLHEFVAKEDFNDPAKLAAAIKRLPVPLLRPRPLDEAISSAGGVTFDSLDAHLMLKAMPGVFCAGEMLDWEAPTGGYLLTACFASGRAAARGALAWLKDAALPR